jgi:N-acetyl-alpha-D-glucosaminyl L-malate synthase BshA
VSQSLINQTREVLQIEKPIDLVYNFIDKREYYPRDMCDVREEYAPNNEKVFIHISNFRSVKRTDDVVRIFHRIKQRIPAKLLMIGEGPDLPVARDLALTLGLRDDVFFLGKQEDIACVLSMADVMLLPSAQESFGLVALEAMACGKPVISSNAGGLPEVVKDGETGFVLPIGDVEGMAEKAIQLVADPATYEFFSQQAIERAYHTFCHKEITRQYEAIYQRVLTGEMESCSRP